MMKSKLLSVVLASVLLGGAAVAEDAAQIIHKSANLTPPDYSQTVLTMELVDKTGKVTEHRQINQYGNRKNDLVQTVFDIRSPASVKDTRILQAEKKGKSDDKWIYLPTLKTTRRIAAAERQKSWVGSDFTYNDMTIRKDTDDDHEMVDENAKAESNGKAYDCWKIKSTPVANKNVEFAYRVQFIEKSTYLPISVEYYDKKGVLIKTQNIEKFIEVTSDSGKKYPLRQFVRVTNKLNGHSSTVEVSKWQFDKPIADKYFTQNWLNTGK